MSKFFEATNKIDPNLADASLLESVPLTTAEVVSETFAYTDVLPNSAITAPAVPVTPTYVAPEVPDPVAPLVVAEREIPKGHDTFHPPFEGIREVSVTLGPGSPVLPFDGADERAAERYRIIRTKLRQDPRGPQLLCVSSSGMGDGKSVNAVNMAGVLALKRDTHVLLVDGDFRRSTLAGMLGLPNGPGLSEVLAGVVDWRDAVVRISEAPNLYFMPAGTQKDNPAELLDSARWKTTCETFRQTFNFVIVDSPPMGTVADYDLIQSQCDGVVLVARQDHSNRARLLKCISSVPQDRLIGVLMNCVSPWTLWRAADDAGDPYGYKPANR